MIFKKIITAAIMLGTFSLTQAQVSDWPVLKSSMKPWVRWWWMGSAVSDTEISALLRQYHHAGLGGVEIAPIYGPKGAESAFIPHLSPTWVDRLQHTLATADEIGMGVDLTNGTGWPFGGPQVTEEYAASNIIVNTFSLSKGRNNLEISCKDPKQKDPPLISLLAYGPENQKIDLLKQVKGGKQLNWTAPAAGWTVYAGFLGKTRQKVKRAAPGGEGYTLDHFSGKALQAYLKPYQEALKAQPRHPRAYYNDSYEVYGANWTAELFDYFKRIKGYDLHQYIGEVFGDVKHPHRDRLKADYRDIVSQLLLENFTKSWTSWSHEMGSVTKNQAHGSPGNLLDLYAAVDIPETETFGSSYFPIQGLRRDSADVRKVDPDPMMLKFASSGAHVLGKTLVSAETFTWLTEHFKTSWAQCKPEVEQLFLSGINHVFYHGTTYSPADQQWPGWLFYASVNFVPTNSLWSHLDGLNSYVTRTQSILQSTANDNEVLLYWPAHDIWNDDKGTLKSLTIHNIDKWLHPSDFYKEAVHLQTSGYSFDFVSDELLKGMTADGDQWKLKNSNTDLPYKVLIVPKVEYMPVETLEKIIEIAGQGGKVIFHQLPADIPGFKDLDKRRLIFNKVLDPLKNKRRIVIGKGEIVIGNDIVNSLSEMNIKGESLIQKGLKFIKRKKGDQTYYYVVNHSDHTIDEQIIFQTKASSWKIMDPLTGQVGKAQSDKANPNQVRVKIRSGEALFFVAEKAVQPALADWSYLDHQKDEVQLNNNWSLQFAEGGPVIPQSKQLYKLQPWTSLSDSIADNFSGKAVYSSQFEMTEVLADKHYVLQLDTLYESAKIRINGQDAGQIWSLPYSLPLGNILKKGTNTIEIEVANLMANRIRQMDRNGQKRQDYYDTKFVNIDYEPFRADTWSVMPSGLAGRVIIKIYD
ncbi:glycosyl hydrolase [Sphingobacterium spiritivorum]|uniref:glycosyl hydrolase n=1 Tax=Sphingobacterium spiritivorum TaxID=258 RepID=UPI003DA51FC7